MLLKEAALSRSVVFALGMLLVLVAATLELRHLVLAIMKHFKGVKSLHDVIARAAALDDATIIGVIMCAALSVAIALTAYQELAGLFDS